MNTSAWAGNNEAWYYRIIFPSSGVKKQENESYPKLNELDFFCNRNQSIFALFKVCVIYQGIEFPRRSGGCRISIEGKQTKEHEL